MSPSLAAQLRADPPRLHGAGSEYWGLAWPALEWLEKNVRPGMATLETGAGSSTILFAAGGAEHEAISPFAEEHVRIREEAAKRGVPTDRVRFHVGSSHEVLPGWEPRPLDIVLVDGAHGFPYPVLDWWHLAPHVKVGGVMLLDDSYMPPVTMLVDYCASSPAWKVLGPVGYRTVVVRKLAEGLPDFDWHGERLGGHMTFRYLPPDERAVASARHRALSTDTGLAAVAAVRRHLPFLFR